MVECILQQLRTAFIKRYKTHPGSKSKIWKYFGLLVTEIGDDEIGDDSEEATEINEPDPPTKIKSKLSDFFADVCKERSKKSKLECVVAEVN